MRPHSFGEGRLIFVYHTVSSVVEIVVRVLYNKTTTDQQQQQQQQQQQADTRPTASNTTATSTTCRSFSTMSDLSASPTSIMSRFFGSSGRRPGKEGERE